MMMLMLKATAQLEEALTVEIMHPALTIILKETENQLFWCGVREEQAHVCHQYGPAVACVCKCREREVIPPKKPNLPE